MITITGQTELAEVLAKLGAQAPAKLGGALYRQAHVIMGKAKAITPHDTGTLMTSGFVEEPKISNQHTVVTLGFGGAASSYAVIVHEDLTPKNWTEPGTGPKYLERPILEAAHTLEADLAKDLRLDVRP